MSVVVIVVVVVVAKFVYIFEDEENIVSGWIQDPPTSHLGRKCVKENSTDPSIR